MMIRIIYCVIIIATFTKCNEKQPVVVTPTGTLTITFQNKVNGVPLLLNVPAFNNSFGENYTITKFKYYISNIAINNIDKGVKEKESYHLIDAANSGSLSFSYNADVDFYNQITFTIGVDSIRNVSGAQTGALDAANDMFWTWSTGYIMAKLEGTSPASTQVNNKIEYHIGGFSGANNVLRTISLTTPIGKHMDIREGKNTEIVITADVNTWWQNPNNITFANNAVCTTPSLLAKQIADNYSKMFTIKDVINY